MKYHSFIHPVLGLALLSTAVAACGDDAMDTETTSTTSTTTTTAGTTTTMGTTTDNPTMGTTTEDPTTEGPTSSSTDPSTSSTTSPGGGYNFPKDPFDAYTQIDRHGAVEAGTAGILAKEGLGFNMGSNIDLRNDYNATTGEPADECAASDLTPEQLLAGAVESHEAQLSRVLDEDHVRDGSCDRCLLFLKCAQAASRLR